MNDAQHMDVSVLGAGGHAKVVIATLRAAGYNVRAVYDDDPVHHGRTVHGVPVVGSVDAYAAVRDMPCCIAIGSNRHRSRMADALAGADWVTAVHPSAVIDDTVRIGVGTVILAGAVIQPDTHIGDHAIVNTGACVDHDCVVGDYAHVAPGAAIAGGVNIGAGVLIGIGSCVLPMCRIGAWAQVAGGAAVIGDVAAGSTVGGTPAELLRPAEVRQ